MVCNDFCLGVKSATNQQRVLNENEFVRSSWNSLWSNVVGELPIRHYTNTGITLQFGDVVLFTKDTGQALLDYILSKDIIFLYIN